MYRGVWPVMIRKQVDGSLIVTRPSFYTDILILAMPLILQQLLRVSVDTLDNMMLGRIDQMQMSAATQAQQIFFVFYTLCNGFSSGCCVLVSQYWGKQDRESIKTLCAIGVQYVAVFALVVTLVIQANAEAVLGLYSSDPELIRLGASYLRIASLMYVPCAISTMLFACCMGIEQTRVSFTTNAVSYPLNVLLDYCFVFGVFGMPGMGIRGIAVGAIIARLVEFGIIASFVFHREKALCMKLKDLTRHNRKLSLDFVKVGMPIVAHELIWSTGTTAGSFIMGHVSTVIVTGYNLAYTLYQLMACFMNGVLHACSVTMGKTIGMGAGKEQIRRESYSLLLIGLAGGILLGVLTLLVRQPFLDLYHLDAETRAYASVFVVIIACIWPFSGMEMTGLIATLRAGGDGKTGFICDIFTMWLITIPLAALCTFVLDWPPYIAIAIIKFNIVLESLVGIWRIHTMKWVKNLTT
ncbi:MAG: MATE family efflux transporter [Clostridiales bacterium]|nr:MATE family efflux transporter [Clostridiales bacterium]